MGEKIILYNIQENMILFQKEKMFLQICKDLDIKAVKLDANDIPRQISDILGIKPVNSPVKSKSGTIDNLPEVLVFNGIDSDLLDRFLAEYKNRKLAPIGLKAVVTPVNMTWTLGMLIGELIKERAAYGE